MASQIITNVGFAIETNLMTGLGGTIPKYVGQGTGVVAASATDVNLGTPSAEARTSSAVSLVTTTVANDTEQYVGTITAAGAQAVTEAGWFDAAGAGSPPAGGVLRGRAVFNPINEGIGDSIQFTGKFKHTSA